MFDGLWKKDWYYTSSISNNIIWKNKATMWLVANIFYDSDETSSLATVSNHFHIMCQSISSIEHLLFSFPSYFFINSLSTSFDLFELCTALNLLLLFVFFQSFCVSVFRSLSLIAGLLLPLLFSLKHMPCHFSDAKFQIEINIPQITFLQCVWIKPYSSSIPNVENSTSKFCQSTQICCNKIEKRKKWWQLQSFLHYMQMQKTPPIEKQMEALRLFFGFII